MRKKYIFIGTSKANPHEPHVEFVEATNEDEALDMIEEKLLVPELEFQEVLRGEHDDLSYMIIEITDSLFVQE